MPETRYVEVYEESTGTLLGKEPYIVSDEELERERLVVKLKQILNKPKSEWTVDEIKTLIEIIGKLMVV